MRSEQIRVVTFEPKQTLPAVKRRIARILLAYCGFQVAARCYMKRLASATSAASTAATAAKIATGRVFVLGASLSGIDAFLPRHLRRCGGCPASHLRLAAAAHWVLIPRPRPWRGSRHDNRR
jgi:hypothetical protein